MFLASLIVLAGLLVAQSHASDKSDAFLGPCIPPCNTTLTSRNGDIVFGGLFPVYKLGSDGCVRSRDTVREFGFERLEAMRFAVDRINEDSNLLPGIQLGYELRDTCSDADYALRQSLHFLNTDGILTPSVGVVGAASSSISIRVTDLLNLFFVPLISYASTSADLSDSVRYPSFFRSIPSDEFQALAMVAIAKEYGWKYVHGVHSDDSYGNAGFQSFRSKATDLGIDIGLQVQLPKTATLDEVKKALAPLNGASGSDNSSQMYDVYKNGSVIVMFSHLDLAQKVLLAVQEDVNLRARKFTFIGSDSWGDKTEALQYNGVNTLTTARGLISVIPSQFHVRDYNEHMAGLNPSNYLTNEWFVDYWDSKLDCNYENKTCSGKALEANLPYDSKVAFVLDAVKAFAHALHNLLAIKCGKTSSCFKAELDNYKNDVEELGKTFKDFVKNVTFESISNETFSFDEHGDFTNAEYDIKNLQIINGEPVFKKIGVWIGGGSSLGKLSINEPIIWHDENASAPQSICSPTCGEGIHREAVEVPGGSGTFMTCWRCKGQCPAHEYLYISQDNPYGNCIKCPPDQKPNKLHTNCTDVPVTYLRWSDGLAIFIIILAIIGSILVILTMVAFGFKWRTPLVMASSRELSLIMLIGMLLSYLLTFVFVAKPTDATCGLVRFFFGVFLSIIFGALLVKTNRISRLFNRKASVQRPICISPTSQLSLTGCITLGASAISVVWLVIAKPEAVFAVTKPNTEVVLKCANIIDYGTLVSWLYIFGLIIGCIVYAYKTRKIPENFKETLFINFAAYAELIIWLAFIPVGFVNIHDKERQAFMSLAMTLTASAAWGCLFVPKLYIILFRPERNIRRPTMRRSSKPSVGDVGRQYSSGERHASYSTNNHINTEGTKDLAKGKDATVLGGSAGSGEEFV